MNVNELLDTIEDLLEESTGMPLSGGKRIVDVEQIRDYLDEIRQNLPVELRQAQSIVSDRAQLIESANAQAQAIVKKAEERARILVSEAEIVRAAQQRASEIVSAAQTAHPEGFADATAKGTAEAFLVLLILGVLQFLSLFSSFRKEKRVERRETIEGRR